MKPLHYMSLMLALAAFVSAPLYVSAHALGASLEREVDGYFIDIGYDPDPLRANRAVRFDFELYDEPATDDLTSTQSVDYTSVWVRLEQNEKTIFATGVSKALWGPTTLLLNLPKTANPLTIHVRYERGEEVLAETSFTLEVERSQEEGTSFGNGMLAAFGGLIVGGILGFLVARRRLG